MAAEKVRGIIDSPGPEGVFRLCWKGCSIYLLWRGEEAVLVGAGCSGHLPLLRDALKMSGLGMEAIRAILFTHAEPALTENAARLKDKTGAVVYVPRLEAGRLSAQIPMFDRGLRGLAQRHKLLPLSTVSPCEADIYIADTDALDLWYGLSVIALPGPTPGHCGFYCRHLNLLFCGALRMEPQTHLARLLSPPVDEELLDQSRNIVAKMHPDLILGA